MNLSWMILPAFALVIGVAAFGVVVAAYSWGRFSSVQALQSAGSRGKAYLAALLPAIVIAISFHMNPELSQHSAYALFWLGRQPPLASLPAPVKPRTSPGGRAITSP